MDKSFLYETSNKDKLKAFFLAISVIIIILALGVAFEIFLYDRVKDHFFIDLIKDNLNTDALSKNPLGLFIIALIGTSVFIPMPIEFIFYYGISRGSPVILSVIFVTLGVLLSQSINYWLGSKFSSIFSNFISIRKLYKARRFANKWGGYGLFFFSMIPAPTELVTFGLGITKYRFYKMVIITLLGIIIKFSVVAGIFLWMHS